MLWYLYAMPFVYLFLLLVWVTEVICYKSVVGLEVSITDPEDLISVKDAKIVVDSQDENKIQVCLHD